MPGMLVLFEFIDKIFLCKSKTFMASYYEWGSTVSRINSNYNKIVYFLLQSPQEFMVLILSIAGGEKSEMTLEPPSGFDPGYPGLGIQHPSELFLWYAWRKNGA